jgi:cellular nucleic acid-binding protein
MSTLYVLQLESGKYYVGKTDDIANRYAQHKSGKGSEWTKIYKPIKMVETRRVNSDHDENNVTKDFMKKYGIENVRGGAYCQVELSEEQEDSIRHELRSTTDNCYKCGKPGHFANKCPKKSSFTGTCGCGKTFMVFEEFMSHNKMCIQRNSTKEVWCCEYCDREFTTKFGATVHERTCKTKHVNKQPQSGVCYRCRRSGHYSPECYAYTTVDGQYLGKPPYDPRYDSDSD